MGVLTVPVEPVFTGWELAVVALVGFGAVLWASWDMLFPRRPR